MKRNFKKVAVIVAAVCLTTTFVPLLAGIGTTKVVTEQAPAAIGPYSQAVHAGNYLFISGQIGIDPAVGKITTDKVELQTRQAIKNIEAIMQAHGLRLENIVKTDVYLKDMKDFSAMNLAYAEHFNSEVMPARATVQVSKLPQDALVEISCTAYIK